MRKEAAMTTSEHVDDHHQHTPPSFNSLLKGAGGCSLIAIAFVGAVVPTFGLEYTTSLQVVAAIAGAAAGIGLSLRD
jgi:hypothetical protein